MVGQMHGLPDVVVRDTDLQRYIVNKIMGLSHGAYVLDHARRFITEILSQVPYC